MANEITQPTTPQGGAGGAQPAKPPDDLLPKEPDEKNFVTEELAKMKPKVHRLLALWFTVLAAGAIFGLIRFWPRQTGDQILISKIDSLKAEIAAQRKAPMDTARVQSTSTGKRGSAGAQDTLKASGGGETREATDKNFIIIALLAGILGGCAAGLSSFMDFRGNRRLFKSWTLWYFGQPLLGGMLSVIFFVVVRAGLFTGDTHLANVNVYGIAAVGAIVGLFTDEATSKLAEVFKTIFATSGKPREGELTADGDKTKKS